MITLKRQEVASALGKIPTTSDLDLPSLFTELARLLGDRESTPEGIVQDLILAGFSHSGQFGLDEQRVRELQQLMRDQLIPALMPDDQARRDATLAWDQIFH